MHDCKCSGLTLTSLAFNEEPSHEEAGLLAEIQACPTCREELISIRNTVRIADDALRAVAPSEDFWPAYHDRLQQRFSSSNEEIEDTLMFLASQWLKPLTFSVRVPLPLAVAMILLLAATSTFSLWQYRREVEPPSLSTSKSTDLMEVPLIRQETITRVVYVNRNRRSSAGVKMADTTTRPGRTPDDATLAGLSGFKPASEIKLTIIKGTAVDEK
jgi:hypothetical protein